MQDLGGLAFADSVGDHMFGFFDNGQTAVFSLSAMGPVRLEANRPNGISRSGHFLVSDGGGQGAGLSWLASGNVGYSGADGQPRAALLAARSVHRAWPRRA